MSYQYNSKNYVRSISDKLFAILLLLTIYIPSCVTTAGEVTAIRRLGIECQVFVSELYLSTESSLEVPSHPPTAYTKPSSSAKPVAVTVQLC